MIRLPGVARAPQPRKRSGSAGQAPDGDRSAAFSRGVLRWLGSTRNTVGCAAGLGGVALGATGVVEAPYWPLATAALYAAGALVAPAGRLRPSPAARHPSPDPPPRPDDAGARAPAGVTAAGSGAADLPVADLPVADLPVADLPVADLPVADLPVADLPVADLASLRAILDERIAGLAGPSSSADPDVVAVARTIADTLRDLLDHPELLPPGGHAHRAVGRIVLDFLPAALDDYLALPRLYARMHELDDGRTPHQVALARLARLATATRAIASAARREDETVAAQDGLFADLTWGTARHRRAT